MSNGEPKSEHSSGNVFEDLGFEPAEARSLLLRSDLMFELGAELRRQNKTQKELGVLLGIGQSRVSDLMKGKARLFSLDMLVTLAEKLGMPVSLELSAKPKVAAKPEAEARVARVFISSLSRDHAGWMNTASVASLMTVYRTDSLTPGKLNTFGATSTSAFPGKDVRRLLKPNGRETAKVRPDIPVLPRLEAA